MRFLFPVSFTPTSSSPTNCRQSSTRLATRGNRLIRVKREVRNWFRDVMNRESTTAAWKKLVPRRSWFNYANRVAGSFRRMSLISGFEQLCPSTKLNPCNSNNQNCITIPFLRPILSKLKSRVSSIADLLFDTRFVRNLRRSLEFSFFRILSGICSRIAGLTRPEKK